MYYRCPLCGSELFYLHGYTNFASFKITLDGRAAELRTKGGEVILKPETTINCLSCSWQGQVRELLAGAQG